VFAEAAAETPWFWDLLGLLSVPALVTLNGLFVATEFSLVAVRRTRVEELMQQRVPGAEAVNAAVTRLDRSIAATQLGITLASIGLGWVGEPALARLFYPLFDFLSHGWHQVAAHSAGTALAFLLITFMHVVFGELVPKALALQTADRTALWTARFLLMFVWITRPITLLMNVTANRVLRLFGLNRADNTAMVHSVQELELLIEDTEEAGILDSEQADLVQNVFRLSDKRVSDCMVSRDKMAALELSSPPELVLEKVRHGAHTRMPVYDGEPNKIVGVVNTKDLFYLFSLRGVVVLEDAMYPALFLKPDEEIATALRLFRQSRRPMALVRDEDGNILGLITLEDVLEEIVGDIEDEHDRPVPRLKRRLRRTSPKPPAVKPPPPVRKG
jgi:putative hemolysin